MDTSRITKRAMFGLLVGLLAAVFTSSAMSAPLPTDLDAVPRDATCFMHFRAAELWQHPALAELRYFFRQAGKPTLKTFQEMFAPNPASIDRVTMVMPTERDFREPFPYLVRPENTSPLFIIHTKEPFDYLGVMEKFAFRDKFYRRHHYYFNEDDWRILVMLDGQTFMIGAEQSLFHYFDQWDNAKTKDNGPLQAALEEAAGQHHVTVGINPDDLKKAPGFQFTPPPLQVLFSARSWVGTASLDKALHLHVRLDFADEKTARAGEQACRTLIALGRNGLKTGIQQLEKELLRDKKKVTFGQLPEKFAVVLGLGALREADRVLRELPVQRKQKLVSASLKYDKLNETILLQLSSYALVFSALSRNASETFAAVRRKLDEKDSSPQQHLKRIAGALEKYHKDKGSYPPAAIYDKYGRPILSWRVTLLPYFGDQEKQLYSQFRLDEPWDGPNNRKLIKQLPQCYRFSRYYSYRHEGRTTTVAFTGKGTIFDGRKGTNKKDIDPKTILVLLGNSETATYWSRPGDVRIEPGKPLPELFSRYGGELYALLADGSVKSIRSDLDVKELRAMIYRKKDKVTAEPAPKYPEAAWEDFMQIDHYGARRALVSMRKLAAMPDKALPFLGSKLKPAARIDSKHVNKLIRDLGSDTFRTRTRANRELTKAGVLVLGTLQRRLKDRNLDLETHMRLEKLVRQAQQAAVTPDELRVVRAVLVLQQIGNAEARSLLTEYAKGAEGAMLTIHARKALRVLADR